MRIRRIICCYFVRRPSLIIFLILSLAIVCWISILCQRSLLQQQEATLIHEDKLIHNVKGKNTPRVLMVASNAKQPSSSLIQNNNTYNMTKGNKSTLKEPASEKAVATRLNITNTTISKRSSNNARDKAHLDPVPSQVGPDSLQLLHQKLLQLNSDQRVLNSDKFPPLSNEEGIVLIVQVHKRENYLKQLLESLKRAKGIEKVLLVISHDYYSDEMNEIVESVDFCRVIQIFYPKSLQIFTESFPGPSKNDCPRNAKKEEALRLNCTNANNPDSYGHYREASVTAIKHHWWWKVNIVFDGLRETSNYSGYVLFLEEDHYVSPDFITVTKLLISLRKSHCKSCDFINLGMYNKVKNYAGSAQMASIGTWYAGKNNMGFGMNRETWNIIKGCAEQFCSYDDYNWDWSLNSLGGSCLKRPLTVIVASAPRILHIGTCGTHHHKSCNEAQQARSAQEKLDAQKAHLFPPSLNLHPGQNPAAPRKKAKNYGGWGDKRDHSLCLSFIRTTPLSISKMA